MNSGKVGLLDSHIHHGLPLKILDEFSNIFGPELKAVTGDPKRIDDVLRRVELLVVPIEEVSFDPFSIKKRSHWHIIMQDFDTKVMVSSMVGT